MSTPTSIYNLPSPGPTTKFKDLGAELLAWSNAIDALLAGFDYNGADPDAVLARVVALEAWRANVTPRLAALETLTTLDNGLIVKATDTTVNASTNLRKRGDGYVSGYLQVNRLADFTNGVMLVTLPAGWRPPATREFVAIVSSGSAPIPVLAQITDSGVFRLWVGATPWTGARMVTVNLGYFVA